MLVFALIVMALAGRLGARVATSIGQPAVLGELLAGLGLGAIPFFAELRDDPGIAFVAGAGAVLLLFETGLESDVATLLKAARTATAVALGGVAGAMALGYLASSYFFPDASWISHLFVAGILCSTGAGVTARVLKDLAKGGTREARIILAAAVIDDVIGLLVMACVTAIAAGSGGLGARLAIAIAKAVAFLGVALWGGHALAKHVFRLLARLALPGVVLASALGFCAGAAWLADLSGLAPIIGAFAAGLVPEEAHLAQFQARGDKSLHDLLRPISTALVPIFFVAMAMRAQLGDGSSAMLGMVLTLAAVVGKQACGLMVRDRAVNGAAVGIGMVPRAEVALIFASAGLTATFQGRPVLSPGVYSAIVLVVLLTTLVTPPALKLAFSRGRPGLPR